MSPEERLGADSNVSVVASVTEVVISGDLQVAKVYVSFFGAPPPRAARSPAVEQRGVAYAAADHMRARRPAQRGGCF